MKNETVFSQDIENKKLTVVRAFDAQLEQVWKAWTESELLDLWWAPKPYKAKTKTMDFREGGMWLYAMIGPEGDTALCRVNWNTIDFHKSITTDVMFCDEEGKPNLDFPVMHWKQLYNGTDANTTVTVEITFDKQSDLAMIMTMGFQEGFTAGLSNLDEYLDTQSKI